MVFYWSLNDSKCPQVSRTFLRILANHSNVVVWMVYSRPVISDSSSPCANLLVTVPRAPITVRIIVTFMFHIFFNSPARCLSFFSLSFNNNNYYYYIFFTSANADGLPLEFE